MGRAPCGARHNIQLFISAFFEPSKQCRLLIPTGGRSFGRRAAVVFQLEQGRLLRLRDFPRLKLLPAQFA